MPSRRGPRVRSLKADELLCPPLEEPAPVAMLLPLPLIIRRRFLKVLHVQTSPPYENEGRQTSNDSLFLTKLKAHVLNSGKSFTIPGFSCDSFPVIRSNIDSWARRDAFAKTICRSPPGLKFTGLATSMMKVGLSSCSRSSIIPTDPSICIPGDLVLVSGVLGVLLDAQLPEKLLIERGGLVALDTLPRASFSVVTPISSRALFNIVAAMSEVVGFGGSIGRCLGVCEKNKGDGRGGRMGFANFFAAWKSSGSRERRGPSLGRFLFVGRSEVEVETARDRLSSDRGCFEAFDVFGVEGIVSGFRNCDFESPIGCEVF